MDEWTLQELVDEAARRLAQLPPPKNGQIRAVPDERTIRYYTAIGLLDRPTAMRGRTALYGKRHLAQLVAIKRLQGADRSLADIRKLWPTLDDHTLARMTGIAIDKRAPRREFWKAAPAATPVREASPPKLAEAVQLRIDLDDLATLVLAIPGDAELALSPADIRAIRAAAAPLVAELARRGLAARASGTLEEP